MTRVRRRPIGFTTKALKPEVGLDKTRSKTQISVYYNLGMVRLKLGDKRHARDMFSRVLAMDGRHHPSIKGLKACTWDT